MEYDMETVNRVAMSNRQTLRVKKLWPESKVSRAHDDDAGLDLYTAEAVYIPAGERRLVPLGVAIELPAGTVGLVYPRSGYALNEGITLANAVGVIDAGYRGELKAPLLNVNRDSPVFVEAGTRVAQLLVQPIIIPQTVFTEDLGASERGEAGFGSTGTQ